MIYRKANSKTHQACRSLLQKAVRRGDGELACKVADHLVSIGDKAWLRQRCIVIAFEECWPLIEWYQYTGEITGIVEQISTIALTVKNKNAAGLGALAYAFSEGDKTAVKDWQADRPIRIVASAIQRPDNFWDWLSKECKTDHKQLIVDKLVSLHKKSGWPWDKAFVQAAGYLYVTEGAPTLERMNDRLKGDFPYWVALDRHTPEGKRALKEAAKQFNVPARQLSWVSFYCESAITSANQPAHWWEREKEWRLDKHGLKLEQAYDLWSNAKQILIDLLEPDAELLRDHLINNTVTTNQLSLL